MFPSLRVARHVGNCTRGERTSRRPAGGAFLFPSMLLHCSAFSPEGGLALGGAAKPRGFQVREGELLPRRTAGPSPGPPGPVRGSGTSRTTPSPGGARSLPSTRQGLTWPQSQELPGAVAGGATSHTGGPEQLLAWRPASPHTAAAAQPQLRSPAGSSRPVHLLPRPQDPLSQEFLGQTPPSSPSAACRPQHTVDSLQEGHKGHTVATLP